MYFRISLAVGATEKGHSDKPDISRAPKEQLQCKN